MPDRFDTNGPVELKTRLLQYRASLFDPETELPTLPVVLDRIRRMLDDKGIVHVLLVRIEHERHLERLVGWERYDGLLKRIATYLGGLLESRAPSGSLLCQEHVRGDVFLVFIADPAEAEAFHDSLVEGIVVTDEKTGDSDLLSIRTGRGVIRVRPALRIERTVYNGILEARQDFHRRGEVLDQARLREVQRILHEGSIRTLFQPIFRLPDREILGYEALSRGPVGSYLEAAENLFGFTEREGLLGEVEMLCIEKALASSRDLPNGAVVFLNMSVLGLEHIEARQHGLDGLIVAAGRSPSETVLEITERTYAESPSVLRKRVARLRRNGFRIAIDDMGTGYSSLHVLAELQPDFIKLDQVLVRDLAGEPIKRNLVSAVTAFARDSRSLVIAEGVEKASEVEVLQELGIALQQGFYFAQPAPALALARG